MNMANRAHGRNGLGAKNVPLNPTMLDPRDNGTDGGLAGQQFSGGLPTRNWSSGVFEQFDNLNGETMTNTILKERDICFSCATRCKRVVEVTEGKYRVDPRYGGPEYETVACFGSYCGIGDLAAVARANELYYRLVGWDATTGNPTSEKLEQLGWAGRWNRRHEGHGQMRITLRLYGALSRYRPADAPAGGEFSLELGEHALVSVSGEN